MERELYTLGGAPIRRKKKVRCVFVCKKIFCSVNINEILKMSSIRTDKSRTETIGYLFIWIDTV